MFLNYQKLEKLNDTSEFGKWFRVTSSMTALECFSEFFGLDNNKLKKSLIGLGLQASDVNKFLDKGFENTGTYSLYSKNSLPKLCPSLAKNGFKPFCSTSTSFAINSKEKRKYNYPIYYIILKSGKKTDLSLGLKCSVTYNEIKTDNGVVQEMWPEQSYSASASDIVTLESTGLAKWNAESDRVVVTAKTVPVGYISPTEINLPGVNNVNDVMITNISLKIKSLSSIFPWTLIVEP